MKRWIPLLLILLLLTGCKPQSQPTPQPPDTPTTPTTPITPEPQKFYEVTDLTETYELDDCISIRITTPVFDLTQDDAEAVINPYYTLLAGKVKDYAEGDLLQQTHFPMLASKYTVTAGYTVTHASANLLSVLWQVDTSSSDETPTQSTRSAATFDMETGNLYPFRDVFSAAPELAREKFVEKARAVIAENLGTAYYFEPWYDLADSALDLDNFYFTPDGVCVFYSRDDLGTATEVCLSYDELADCLTILP